MKETQELNQLKKTNHTKSTYRKSVIIWKLWVFTDAQKDINAAVLLKNNIIDL